MSNAASKSTKSTDQQVNGMPVRLGPPPGGYVAVIVDGEWRVETIDHESEGQCYVTLFPGLNGEYRAREYAEFKNA